MINQLFFEKAFWLLMAGISALAVKYLSEISKSIADIKVSLNAVTFKIDNHENRLRDLEDEELDHK